MNELLEKINEAMVEFKEQAEKRAVKGNVAAGARSRKVSLVIASLMKEWRKESVKKD